MAEGHGSEPRSTQAVVDPKWTACKCGHARYLHDTRTGWCTAAPGGDDCDCGSFVALDPCSTKPVIDEGDSWWLAFDTAHDSMPFAFRTKAQAEGEIAGLPDKGAHVEGPFALRTDYPRSAADELTEDAERLGMYAPRCDHQFPDGTTCGQPRGHQLDVRKWRPDVDPRVEPMREALSVALDHLRAAPWHEGDDRVEAVILAALGACSETAMVPMAALQAATDYNAEQGAELRLLREMAVRGVDMLANCPADDDTTTAYEAAVAKFRKAHDAWKAWMLDPAAPTGGED